MSRLRYSPSQSTRASASKAAFRHICDEVWDTFVISAYTKRELPDIQRTAWSRWSRGTPWEGASPPSARDSLKGPDFGNFDALQCSTNFSWCGDISSLSAFFHTKQRSQLTVSVYRPTHSKLILPISGLSIQNSLKIFPFEKSYCEQKGLGFIDWVVSFRIPLR